MAPSTALPTIPADTASLIAATARDQENDLAEQLIGRAAAAHRSADHLDGADAAYLLGERNAYAEAAGLALSHGVESLTYAIANRITDDLTDGLRDPDQLVQRASRLPRTEAAEATSNRLEWIGPLAFTRRYAGEGVDEDFGTGWGSRHDQRITHRHQLGCDDGLLYAYDPTWREYAVLGEHVSLREVRDAYAHALGTNPHVPVGAFASQVTHASDPSLNARPAEVEL
ncbi:MAG TPA: hypothetical protein VFX16_16845 [Pseudonocardiaceae bacterium]|nr:hypothetical protein [Pseudonocardiaceae bacterium]